MHAFTTYRSSGKRLSGWGAVLFLLYTAVVSGSISPAVAEPALSPVITGPIRVGPLTRQVSTYGKLAPRIQDLSFQVGGRLSHFEVEEGDNVIEGQLLAALDTADAKDAVSKQAIQLQQAHRNYQRMDTLHAKGSIQKSQLEDSAARLTRARLAHEQAKLNLERCFLYAPSDGLVLREMLESLTTINAGQAIFSFQSFSEDWITKVDLTDRNAFAMGEGARARIRFAPFPGVDFEGRLSKLARVANPIDALYTAEVTINPGRYALRPGMVAEVDLYQTSKQNYSVVPFDALVDLRGWNGTVYLMREGEIEVHGVEVTLVAVQGVDAALVEDLSAYDRVVVRGQRNIADGDRVRILP